VGLELALVFRLLPLFVFRTPGLTVSTNIVLTRLLGVLAICNVLASVHLEFTEHRILLKGCRKSATLRFGSAASQLH
jgi:hypothetical protein